MWLMRAISWRTSLTTARAGLVVGQVAADDFDDAGNSRQRISNFVSQPGGHFAQGCEVLGAGHLRAVQAFDFAAVLAQLLDHVVEVAAEVADFVVTVSETDRDAEIAAARVARFSAAVRPSAAAPCR